MVFYSQADQVCARAGQGVPAHLPRRAVGAGGRPAERQPCWQASNRGASVEGVVIGDGQGAPRRITIGGADDNCRDCATVIICLGCRTARRAGRAVIHRDSEVARGIVGGCIGGLDGHGRRADREYDRRSDLCLAACAIVNVVFDHERAA